MYSEQSPEIIGKRAKMKFVDEKQQEQWYEGVISSYSVITGKYTLFFQVMDLQKRHHMKMKIWKLLTKTAENYFSVERQSLLFIQTDYYSFASILFIFVFHGNQ